MTCIAPLIPQIRFFPVRPENVFSVFGKASCCPDRCTFFNVIANLLEVVLQKIVHDELLIAENILHIYINIRMCMYICIDVFIQLQALYVNVI